MDGLKVLYKNDAGVVIVRLSDDLYYYGNGKAFGGLGVAPTQFLRFNPNLEYVGDKKEELKQEIIDDILRKMDSFEKKRPPGNDAVVF